jgi:membrane-bound lytic murein transglycosylase B
MEKFLGVAEYETRKLVGQHTALRQPAAPSPAGKARRKRPASRPGARPVEGQPAPAPEALEAPVPAQDAPEPGPASQDQTDPQS